jgi:hypothetical protein
LPFVTVAALTAIANAASDAEDVPSLTEMVMPEKEPTLLEAGVPVSAPVVVLKLAQAGLLVIEKVSVLPLGSVVLGVKLYAVPAVTDVAGVPLIVGGDEVVVDEPPPVGVDDPDEVSGALVGLGVTPSPEQPERANRTQVHPSRVLIEFKASTSMAPDDAGRTRLHRLCRGTDSSLNSGGYLSSELVWIHWMYHSRLRMPTILSEIPPNWMQVADNSWNTVVAKDRQEPTICGETETVTALGYAATVFSRSVY